MQYIDSNFKINLLRGAHICQADCVAKDDLEFMILWPSLPQCWDGTPGVYDHPILVYESLGIEPRPSFLTR